MKNKLDNIKTFARTKSKKFYNSIKYYPISRHIHTNFGNKENLIKYNHSRTTGPEPCVCHAPLRSLYFDMKGNITACCFNRVHIFGKYPQKNIKEIIYNEKREFLQKELCRQNFMYGCQHCHKLIEAQNFEGVEAKLYDNLKDQGNIPSEMVFELDNTCNLACEMCHEGFSSTIAKLKGIEIPAHPYDADFLAQLKEFIPHLKIAKFLGGEPFLINIYYQIWDLILELNPNCKIHLQTNGTVFNEKIESYLRKGRFYIGVSIDSLRKENYEKIRRNANFDKVMENLYRFAEIAKQRNTFINISVCPMIQNWEEITEIVDFCNKNSFFVYFNTVYTPGFSLRDADEDFLLKIKDYYKNFKFYTKGIIAKRNLKFFNNLTSQIEDIYNQKEKDSRYEKKRHKWTNSMLKEFMFKKINNDKELLDKIDDVFFNLGEEYSFSDKDLENLEKLKAEDLISALKNEALIELQERIKRFINFGRFSK
ncbi:MAG: molybdenum cofactor biosynthesis protein A [Bacteroidetes bacterium ADurb.Bin028]|nr:MAG: molybdenum cofactor biosynthesis protein A [Bacteroidetes bacterium ADurb.Bin028]